MTYTRFELIAKLLRHYHASASDADNVEDRVAALWHCDTARFVGAGGVPGLFARDKFCSSHADLLAFVNTWPPRSLLCDTGTTKCLFHISHAVLTLLTDVEAEQFYNSLFQSQ